jgi:hypothetical protein
MVDAETEFPDDLPYSLIGFALLVKDEIKGRHHRFAALPAVPQSTVSNFYYK